MRKINYDLQFHNVNLISYPLFNVFPEPLLPVSAAFSQKKGRKLTSDLPPRTHPIP